MRVIRIVKIVAAVAAVLLLAGCILEPQDNSGSITFTVSAPQASISGSSIAVDGDVVDPDADVTHARVWMYINGSEYRLAPTSASAPSSRNYVEADLRSGSATVTIDGIPAGGGYSAVIILGTKSDDVFVPLSYARTGRFTVNAGLPTQLAPQKIALADDGDENSPLDSAEFRLPGKNLNSVVVSNEVVISADSTTVYEGLTDPIESGGFGTINRLSTGTFANGAVWFVNSSEGIYQNGTKITSSDITDVTFSGAFTVTVDGTDEDVVFYQRKGGLGGAARESGSSTYEWEDFGSEDLQDFIDPDTSPVRAQASGSDSGFFATAALDNFRLTEALFDVDSDVEAEDLISRSVDGVDFFNVPYPGTTQPMRINHMEVVNVTDTETETESEYLVVGTPRGAFAFPQENIGNTAAARFNSSTNVVNATHGSFRSIIRDESAAALATDEEGEWLAVATAETIVVLNVARGIPQPQTRAEAQAAALFILPRRGVALGEVTGLALDVNASRVQLHISGTQGLTSIAKQLSQ